MNLKRFDDFFLLNRKGKLTALDGIRGWAVFMVFMFHFASAAKQYFGEPSQWQSGLRIIDSLLMNSPFIGSKGGNLGVDLFFILSGFLIFGSLSRKKVQFRDFLISRFKRLLPAHLVVIMSSLTVLPFLAIITNGLLINYFFPSLPTANFVTWALSYELLFYILCAFWFIGGAKIIMLHTWRFLLFAFILFFLSHDAVSEVFKSISMQYVERDRFMAFFFGLALGKLFFASHANRKKIEHIFRRATFPSFIMVGVLKILWDHQFFTVFAPFERTIQFVLFDISAFFLIGSLVFAPKTVIYSLFNARPLRFLGAVSYSFFLSHAIWGVGIGARISDFMLPGGGGFKIILYFVITVLTTFIISTFMFHFLEKPYYAKK